MTAAARCRCVVVALFCFALWPLAQHQLARSFQINPWKLGGFAMYTTPAPPLEVGWIAVGRSGPERIDPGALSRELQLELRRFELRRHALGRLASPALPAQLVLDELPAHEAVMAVIRRYTLDPRTARFHMNEVRELVTR